MIPQHWNPFLRNGPQLMKKNEGTKLVLLKNEATGKFLFDIDDRRLGQTNNIAETNNAPLDEIRWCNHHFIRASMK